MVKSERVEYWSRGSLGPDESPPKDDAFVRYELDDLAVEPADVCSRLDMPDAKVAAHARLDLGASHRDPTGSQPAPQEIRIEPRVVHLTRRSGHHALQSYGGGRSLLPSHRFCPFPRFFAFIF